MCTYYCSSLLLRDLQKASFFSRVANSVHLKRGRPHRLVMVNRRSWQPFGDGQTPAAEGLCYIPVSVQLYKYRRREGHRVTSANSPARASRPCLRTSKQSLFTRSGTNRGGANLRTEQRLTKLVPPPPTAPQIASTVFYYFCTPSRASRAHGDGGFKRDGSLAVAGEPGKRACQSFYYCGS